MTVDTLEYVKKLEAAGVDQRQAEAHAEALRDAVVPQLVTKPDLDAAAAQLESDIDLLKTEVAGKFTLLYWMLGANIGISLGVLWRLLR
jgi:hypothetical protein